MDRTKEKRCIECRQVKVLADFPLRGKPPKLRPARLSSYGDICRVCKLDRNNTYRSPAERHGRDRSDRAYRFTKYGLSQTQFIEMSAAQRHACAICQSSNQPLVIDHCHTTGAVRGLLCNRCNTALGMLDDSQSNLSNALSYLTRPNLSA